MYKQENYLGSIVYLFSSKFKSLFFKFRIRFWFKVALLADKHLHKLVWFPGAYSALASDFSDVPVVEKSRGSDFEKPYRERRKEFEETSN